MTKEFDERNMAKSRRVCEDMEAAHVTQWRKLTELERQILDMWPKFEDGEYVWFGDEVKADPIYGGDTDTVHAIEFMSYTYILSGYLSKPIAQDRFEARVKRPVQSVLDADGVEIEVGDTVWFIPAVTDTPDESYEVTGINKYGEVLLDFHFERSTGMKGEYLTHTRPDSWERLEEDAVKEPCDYFGVECDEDKGCSGCPHLHEGRDCAIALQADLIRRAKALAGVEVDA